jgi:hypothetical protein
MTIVVFCHGNSTEMLIDLAREQMSASGNCGASVSLPYLYSCVITRLPRLFELAFNVGLRPRKIPPALSDHLLLSIARSE